MQTPINGDVSLLTAKEIKDAKAALKKNAFQTSKVNGKEYYTLNGLRIKISHRQHKVLVVLVEAHKYDLNCLYIHYLADKAGLTHREARLAVRALARKGLAELVRGLVDADGFLAGSGYRATNIAYDFLYPYQIYNSQHY